MILNSKFCLRFIYNYDKNNIPKIKNNIKKMFNINLITILFTIAT